jgi:hypothetical protein
MGCDEKDSFVTLLDGGDWLRFSAHAKLPGAFPTYKNLEIMPF